MPDSLPGRSGLLAGLASALLGARHGIDYFDGQRVRYGDIYRSMFGPLPVVFVWDADAIHRILRNEDGAWSAAMGWDQLFFGWLEPEQGNFGALSSLDFEAHRSARKLVMPAFTPRAMKGYVETIRGVYERRVPGWVANGHVAFKPAVRALLAELSTELLTGVTNPEHVAQIDRALTDFWHGPLAVLKDTRLSPTWRRSRRGYQTLRAFFSERVAERRQNPGPDLFSQLCRIEPEDGESDAAMIGLFLNIMFGAFDTTSLGVTSMIYLLAKHPHWQERLREEVLSAGDDPSALARMNWVDCAWKESLRLMPLSAGVPRRTLREVELLGHRLPAGTFVLPAAVGMGRHPRWWSEPMRFDPARFSPERAEDKRHPAQFLPFGSGPHVCVGMQLAGLEVKLLCQALLRRCRFELAPDYDAHHTLAPLGSVSGDVRLRLTPLS